MSFPSPALEPPTLEDYQVQYNGFTFGAGTAVAYLNVEGLDLAEIRSGDVNFPRDHGQAMGLDLYAGRDIIFDLWMKSGGVSLQKTQLELAAATVVRPNEELPLWFQLPNLPLLCVMCRPRKRPMKIESDYAAANIGKPELILHATDPRIYSEGEETSIAPGKTVTLTNTGNTEMRPILVFTGPTSAPRMANTTIPGEPKIELINPKERLKRETEEEVTRKAREAVEAGERKAWYQEEVEFFITKKQREEKEAEQKIEIEADEGEEKTAREEGELDEKEKREKGEELTIEATDQILVDLGTPHLIQYYDGGIGVGKPENVSNWLVPGSVWWDLLLGANKLKFSSDDESGTSEVQWASAYQL